MGFKADVKNDLRDVFMNADEHADVVKVLYDGRAYELPVIVSGEGSKDRVTTMRDNADGVFLSGLKAYIAHSGIKIMPRKETRITIGGMAYMIKKTALQAGLVVLDLEAYDE